MSLRLAALLSAAALCGGCEVVSEIGKPCVLVRKATQEELQADPSRTTRFVGKDEIAPGQDVISFGALDCEDLICVRDKEYSSPDEQADNLARGYCSKACVESQTETCTVTDKDVPQELAQRMTCRPLLLDQQALDDLRRDDPEAYRKTFGDNTSPYFCAGAPSTQGG